MNLFGISRTQIVLPVLASFSLLLCCLAGKAISAQVTSQPAAPETSTPANKFDVGQVNAIRLPDSDVYIAWTHTAKAAGYYILRVANGQTTTFGPSAPDVEGYLDARAPDQSVYYVKGFADVQLPSDPAPAGAKPVKIAQPTNPPRTPPANFSAKLVPGKTTDTIEVTWTSLSSATGYDVRCKRDGQDAPDERIIGTTNCQCSFPAIPPGQPAQIQIIPYSAGGEGQATEWFAPVAP
jgi:hypothetical protein